MLEKLLRKPLSGLTNNRNHDRNKKKNHDKNKG